MSCVVSVVVRILVVSAIGSLITLVQSAVCPSAYSTTNLYLLPPLCPAMGGVQACNDAFTLCLSNHTAGQHSCSHVMTNCTSPFLRCVSHVVTRFEIANLTERAECTWYTSFHTAFLDAMATTTFAEYNGTNLGKSCGGLVCRVQKETACIDGAALPLNATCNVPALQTRTATPAATLSEHPTATKHFSRTVTKGGHTITRFGTHTKHGETRTLEASLTRTLIPETPIPPTPVPPFNYNSLEARLEVGINTLHSQLGNDFNTLIPVLPLPLTCPSFMASVDGRNGFDPTYNMLVQSVNHSMSLTGLVENTELLLQVSFQQVLEANLQLTINPNSTIEALVNTTYDQMGVLHLVHQIKTIFSFCLATPSPPTSTASTAAPPTTTTTAAPPVFNTTAALATTTVSPFTPEPTTVIPDITLPPSEQLKYIAEVRNTPTDPFRIDTFTAALARILNCAPGELVITLISTNTTVGQKVDLEVTFKGNNARALQTQAAGLDSAQLRSAGILQFNSAPVIATEAPPEFLTRNRSLVWVGGAAFLGFVVLVGGVIFYCNNQKRRRQALEEAEQWQQYDHNQALLQTPQAMQHHRDTRDIL